MKRKSHDEPESHDGLTDKGDFSAHGEPVQVLKVVLFKNLIYLFRQRLTEADDFELFNEDTGKNARNEYRY